MTEDVVIASTAIDGMAVEASRINWVKSGLFNASNTKKLPVSWEFF